MAKWKYVKSGLWDGHFRDSDSREGLVLRSPTLTGSTCSGRFGRPLQPRWPFGDEAQTEQLHSSSRSIHTAGYTDCNVELDELALETSSRTSSPRSSVSKVSKAQRVQRAQELLWQLATYRQEAEVKVARVWATAIKTAGADCIPETNALQENVEERRNLEPDNPEPTRRICEVSQAAQIRADRSANLLFELDMLRAKMREELAMLEADAESTALCLQSEQKYTDCSTV